MECVVSVVITASRRLTRSSKYGSAATAGTASCRYDGGGCAVSGLTLFWRFAFSCITRSWGVRRWARAFIIVVTNLASIRSVGGFWFGRWQAATLTVDVCDAGRYRRQLLAVTCSLGGVRRRRLQWRASHRAVAVRRHPTPSHVVVYPRQLCLNGVVYSNVNWFELETEVHEVLGEFYRHVCGTFSVMALAPAQVYVMSKNEHPNQKCVVPHKRIAKGKEMENCKRT